ncbi:hypothetical protein [Streptomyces sp. x-80]|uniref:hypothetical protein n=1 Tax=Streptomyces sp. x-80 TaxID=2789282 RepID=UPI0039804991
MIVTSAYGERIQHLKQRTGVQRLRGLVGGTILALSLAAMVAAALLTAPPAFAAAALLSYGADLYLHRAEPKLMRRLGQLRAGVTMRAMLRCALLLVLQERMSLLDDRYQVFVEALLLAFLVEQVVFSAMCLSIRRHRAMPVATRNINLGRLRIPDTPPLLLTGWPGQRMLHLEFLIFTGLAITAFTDIGRWLLGGVLTAVLISTVTLLAIVPHLIGAMRFPSRERVLKNVNGWLRHYCPETILYFSGSRDSAYQVNMWLETLAALETRPLIVLRERHLLSTLKSTHLPILCVPSAVHLMNMELSSVRVALYAANVGKNIHLLRVPTIKHVFIGHGDSDKIASVNPYSKVYDEVWVAGRAGRERYRVARVGVVDSDIVEVGRPQLDGVQMADAGASAPAVPTVLYAPTWEGWTDDPGNTSLTLAGERIVSALLKSERPLRVLYKPHPFTGTRSPAALRAHLRIVRMIEQANEARCRGERFAETPAQQQHRAERMRSLERLEQERAALEAPSGRAQGDDAQRSREGAAADLELTAKLEALQSRWHKAFWESKPPWEHLVIQGNTPTLYDCFDQSDLLISDISSVVSDFVASLKPYALTDTAEVGEYWFRRQNTVARAAYLLTADASGIQELVDVLFEDGPDRLREDRVQLRDYLLGPAEPPSLERFNEALRRLAHRDLVNLSASPENRQPTFAELLNRSRV